MLAQQKRDREAAWKQNQEEMNQRRKVLRQAMRVLNEREQMILTARRLSEDPQTLEELSQEHSISRERVRQIEARAFEKIQQFMQSAEDVSRIKK